MTDAQLGLLMATPILVGLSVALQRMGVLQRYSATIADGAFCVIAAVLLFQQ